MMKFIRNSFTVLTALAVLSGCISFEQGSLQDAEHVYARYWSAYLALDTLKASEVGVHQYNAVYPLDIGDEYRRQLAGLEQRMLDRAVLVDTAGFTDQQRWTHEAFLFQRRVALERLKYPDHLLPLNQFFNRPVMFARMGSGTDIHPFTTVNDYEDFLSRMDGFVLWIDQAIANMRQGKKLGVTQPAVIVMKIASQLGEYVDKHPQETAFWKPIAAMPAEFPAHDRQRLTDSYRKKLADELLPAYSRLHAFVVDEYLPSARMTEGYGALPNGQRWYQSTILEMTNRQMSAEDIHSIGLREVSRLQDLIRRVMKDVDFEGSLQDFFRYMNESPSFQPESAGEILAVARTLQQTTKSRAADYFSLLPDHDFVIQEMDPVIGAHFSGAYYQVGAPDGSRPGAVAVNTTNLPARLSWIMPVMMLHEGAPGHHYQMSLQQQLDLPEFQKHTVNMAFVEGWATYAETLGSDMQAYDDPYSHFGVLNSQLWRAVRLVVDTGLHSKGWTREDALRYMRQNSASSEALLTAEVERYMIWPGQALSYMIGALTFRDLRDEASLALGDRFDVREFHRLVLEGGALPLDVLEAKVREWVRQQQE